MIDIILEVKVLARVESELFHGVSVQSESFFSHVYYIVIGIVRIGLRIAVVKDFLSRSFNKNIFFFTLRALRLNYRQLRLFHQFFRVFDRNFILIDFSVFLLPFSLICGLQYVFLFVDGHQSTHFHVFLLESYDFQHTYLMIQCLKLVLTYITPL